MDKMCPKCSAKMEAGVATAFGLIGAVRTPVDKPRLVFVVPGEPTSPNPVEAFKQGLADEPANESFWIRGQRCSRCGFLELFAMERSVM